MSSIFATAYPTTICEIKTFFENVLMSMLCNVVRYATDVRYSLASDDFKA
jgi:hypothetical protein